MELLSGFASDFFATYIIAELPTSRLAVEVSMSREYQNTKSHDIRSWAEVISVEARSKLSLLTATIPAPSHRDVLDKDGLLSAIKFAQIRSLQAL